MPQPKPRQRGQSEPWRTAKDEDGPVRLFGIHPVEAALGNPRRLLQRLRLTENAEARLAAAVATRAVKVERVSPRELDRLLGEDTVHQGAYLETAPLGEPTLAELAGMAGNGEPIVMLDQVTDPHNVGAILRSAAVFGAAGFVMTRRNSPPLAGALAKAASGALEYVPVALVANLSQAISTLKDLGVRVVGLTGEAPALLEAELLDSGPKPPCMALVLGAEGKGLRQLTRENCDVLASIAVSGPLDSLNVSNAAAVALHLAAMRRRRG